MPCMTAPATAVTGELGEDVDAVVAVAVTAVAKVAVRVVLMRASVDAADVVAAAGVAVVAVDAAVTRTCGFLAPSLDVS